MTKKQHITARKPLSTSGARCGHRFGLCGSGRLPRRQKHGDVQPVYLFSISHRALTTPA